MDLRDFYFENIQKTEWHYRFIKDINEVGEREIFLQEKKNHMILPLKYMMWMKQLINLESCVS